MNGRFHGLLVDLTQRTATLFNDRYGMERIIFMNRRGLLFAAEAKAILAVVRAQGLEVRGWGIVSAVCSGESTSSGIEEAPRRGQWIFRNAIVEQKATYFTPASGRAAPLEPERIIVS